MSVCSNAQTNLAFAPRKSNPGMLMNVKDTIN